MNDIPIVNSNIFLAKNTDNSEQKYLIFQLKDTLYGIAIIDIVEIIEYQIPSKVPNLPVFLYGLLNLRGKLLPIIDLNAYLGGVHSTITKRTCIIIVNYSSSNETHLAGIIVDNVLDVVAVNLGTVEKPPDFAVNLNTQVVKGIVISSDKIITLLDVHNIFINSILVQS